MKKLTELTVKELRGMAKEKGLTGYSNMKKEDIINLIVNAAKAVEIKSVETSQTTEADAQVENKEEEKEMTTTTTATEGKTSSRKHIEMVVLNEHVRTPRYRYLITTLANQQGLLLKNNEDGTISAIGTEKQLAKLTTDFQEFSDLIDKMRVKYWRIAKKDGKLVAHMERSLIVGMLHGIRSLAEFKVRNKEVEETIHISQYLHDADRVEEWYTIGKELITTKGEAEGK